MTTTTDDEAAPAQYIDREHTRCQYLFLLTSVSMCITVDILQYAMPLAFLPSVLEDRGHSPEKIAMAIGVYYYTGLLGGAMLTSYEIYKMFYVKAHDVDITTFADVKRQLKIIIFNLGIGVLTLFVQAWSPRMAVHTACRFIQGFVGAFLFFFVFLLNVAIFKGQQRVVAMSFASCATVLAELAGPLLGSVLYDNYGQSAVFWFLSLASIVNQVMLVGVFFTIKHTTEIGSAKIADKHPQIPDEADEAGGVSQNSMENRWTPLPGAWIKMKTLLQDATFICAVLMITMAGVIKGSVEEMLPFHADHEWGYDPVQIGKLFCTMAVAYLIGAASITQFWLSLGRFQIGFSSQCILLLGVATWVSFHVYAYYGNETMLIGSFATYGLFAGLAFTSAAQLIAEVVDKSEGHAKDAANGMWNTMWELGGSTGFALGGFLAHHYSDQQALTTKYLIASMTVAFAMISVSVMKGTAADKSGKVGGAYGSTT